MLTKAEHYSLREIPLFAMRSLSLNSTPESFKPGFLEF